LNHIEIAAQGCDGAFIPVRCNDVIGGSASITICVIADLDGNVVIVDAVSVTPFSAPLSSKGKALSCKEHCRASEMPRRLARPCAASLFHGLRSNRPIAVEFH
jgi:hypothetical protein